MHFTSTWYVLKQQMEILSLIVQIILSYWLKVPPWSRGLNGAWRCADLLSDCDKGTTGGRNEEARNNSWILAKDLEKKV